MTNTFEQLLEEYKATFPTKIKDLEASLENLHAPVSGSESIEQLHGLVHKLSGSSGAYGMDELHSLASELNTQLKSVMQGNSKIAIDKLKDNVEDLIRQLRQDGC